MIEIVIKRIESATVLKECAEILKKAYNAEPWYDEWTSEKAVEKLMCYYDTPRFIGWVAMHDQTITGACVGNVEPFFSGDHFFLKEIFLSPEYQCKGIGSELINVIKNHLEILDIKTIILCTSRDLYLYDFYRKNDFNLIKDMCMMSFENKG